MATFNINGIRAAGRRGLGAWLAGRGADVVALQEVRCPADRLPEGAFGAYCAAYDAGQRPGRSGVAVLTRHPPEAVRTWGAPVLRVDPAHPGGPWWRDSDEVGPLARGLAPFAEEGRYVEVDLADRPLTVATLYLPKGGLPAHLQRPGSIREPPDGGAKHARKMRFLGAFGRQLHRTRRRALAAGRELVLLGDLNIAHGELDLTHWRRSSTAEGFLPEERAWLDAQLGPRRLVDVQRACRPGVPGPWSWWSWMGSAFEKDVGWRIDYQLATPRLARTALAATTDRPATREERLSDHAAVVVDYDLSRLPPMTRPSRRSSP